MVKYFIRVYNEDYDYVAFVGADGESAITTRELKGFSTKEQALSYMREKNVPLDEHTFIVNRGRYELHDELMLMGVFWSEDRKCFDVKRVPGEFYGTHVKFEERCFDQFAVDYDLIGRVVGPNTEWEAGGDCNAVFCYPGEENVHKAKLKLLEFYGKKANEAKKEARRQADNYVAMRAHISYDR